jgi:hypothetical protein
MSSRLQRGSLHIVSNFSHDACHALAAAAHGGDPSRRWRRRRPVSQLAAPFLESFSPEALGHHNDLVSTSTAQLAVLFHLAYQQYTILHLHDSSCQRPYPSAHRILIVCFHLQHGTVITLPSSSTHTERERERGERERERVLAEAHAHLGPYQRDLLASLANESGRTCCILPGSGYIRHSLPPLSRSVWSYLSLPAWGFFLRSGAFLFRTTWFLPAGLPTAHSSLVPLPAHARACTLHSMSSRGPSSASRLCRLSVTCHPLLSSRSPHAVSRPLASLHCHTSCALPMPLHTACAAALRRGLEQKLRAHTRTAPHRASPSDAEATALKGS